MYDWIMTDDSMCNMSEWIKILMGNSLWKEN